MLIAKLNCCLLQLFSNRLGQRMRSSTAQSSFKYRSSNPLKLAYYVTDLEWASKIAKAAGLTCMQNKLNFVFQANPGNGPLTKCILAECTNHVVAWEPRSIYWNYLDSVAMQYPSNFEYRRKSFMKESTFTLPKCSNSLTCSSNLVSQPIVVIGNFECMRDLIPRLVYQLSQNHGPWRLGNVKFYLLVTGFEYRLITEANYFWHRRQHLRTSLYELFFNSNLVLTIPITSFNCSTVTETSSSVEFDCDNMYLMELSLKNDNNLVSSMSNQIKISGLVRLLKWINIRRRHRVISTFENFCPAVGLPLIELGVTMIDCFSDLPVAIWPEVYNIIISNNHYPYSPLKHLLEGTEKLNVDDSYQEL